MIILLPALNAGCDSRSFSSGDVGRHKGTLFLVQESPGYEHLSLVSGTAALALAGVPALTSLIAGLTAALAPT